MCASVAKRDDCQQVCKEKRRLLPDLSDRLVWIVRHGRAGERGDALRSIHVGQQAVVGAIDRLAFLTLLDDFDGQTQLLLNLVVRATVQI